MKTHTAALARLPLPQEEATARIADAEAGKLRPAQIDDLALDLRLRWRDLLAERIRADMDTLGLAEPRPAAPAGKRRVAGKRDARGHAVTPASVSARKIAGRYMGALHALRSLAMNRSLARVKACRVRHGVVAATVLAHRLLRRQRRAAK